MWSGYWLKTKRLTSHPNTPLRTYLWWKQPSCPFRTRRKLLFNALLGENIWKVTFKCFLHIDPKWSVRSIYWLLLSRHMEKPHSLPSAHLAAPWKFSYYLRAHCGGVTKACSIHKGPELLCLLTAFSMKIKWQRRTELIHVSQLQNHQA